MYRRLLMFSSILIIIWAAKDKTTYMSFERPIVDFIHNKYVLNLTLWSRRMSRKNPIHYFGVDIVTNQLGNNSYMFDFYFYQFTSNRYQRSFVEMHIKCCDLILHNDFFGETVRKSGLDKCPVQPGHYVLDNMMIPTTQIPKGFPFRKGRIYLNVSYIPEKEIITRLHVDMELKEVSISRI